MDPIKKARECTGSFSCRFRTVLLASALVIVAVVLAIVFLSK